MKALVLEVKNGYSAVLREDGTVEKVMGVYEVGQTIQVPVHAVPAWRKSLRAAVAAVALVGVLSAGGWSYQNVMAYSYATLDVGGASIEYTLNRRDQVIGVTARNSASEEAVEALRSGVRNQSLSDAIDETMNYLEDDLENDSYAHVAVSSGNDQRAEKLAGAVDEAMAPRKDRFDFHAETATPEERREARQQDMSMGRWQLQQRSGQSGDFRNGDMDELIQPGNPDPKASGTGASGTVPPPPVPTAASGNPASGSGSQKNPPQPRNEASQNAAPQGGTPQKGSAQTGTAPGVGSTQGQGSGVPQPPAPPADPESPEPESPDPIPDSPKDGPDDAPPAPEAAPAHPEPPQPEQNAPQAPGHADPAQPEPGQVQPDSGQPQGEQP